MLRHIGGPFEQAPRSSGGRKRVRTGLAAARLATMKRVRMRALAVVAVGALLAAIVALDATFYLSRLNY
jgi:hypothetical protein